MKRSDFLKRLLATRHTRRRGVVTVYVALGMVVFLSVAAISVDISFLYHRKAKAQLAADAAALGGAYVKSQFGVDQTARDSAANYATANGYTNGVANTSITMDPNANSGSAFKVTIVRPESTFFASIVGKGRVPVGASATAIYSTFAPLDIAGGGSYGQPDGPTTLSVFGPDGFYNNGDNISTKLLANGSPNPQYDGLGYDFTVTVPFSYTSTDLDIFDPDSYNAGGIADALQNVRIDELRTPSGAGGTLANATTTRYQLFWDNGTPDNINDDILVPNGDRSYGNDATTDMKWNSVFTFNRANYPTGNFRLNVTTTAGSSENGFTLRAKPTGSTFNANNGTKITSQKQLPMNFNKDGQASIALGAVPAQAAGKALTINMFDTDVGGNNRVAYTCDTLPGQSWTFALPGNGQSGVHTITLPSNYQGGTWTATYTAGNQDTSVWSMSYTGVGPGRPGKIKLVN